jgi:GMP synthase-like glutamine amidotransferase
VTVRVGVVANIEDPEAGFVEERFEQLGATFVRRCKGEPLALEAFERDVDLLVLLGSDWSVYDPAFTASIGAERALIERATEIGCPTLGICFGGQLIASAFGHTVARAAVGEIGWVEIECDAPELFGNGPWFQYHLDRWSDGPPGSAFARSAVAPQAVLHRRTLGLQFHPEVTSEVIERWVTSGSEDLEAVGVTVESILADTATLRNGARERCFELVDAFVDRVASTELVSDGRHRFAPSQGS